MINQRTIKKQQLLQFFFKALTTETCTKLFNFFKNSNHSSERKKFLVGLIHSELNSRNPKDENSFVLWIPKISSFKRMERVEIPGYEEFLSKDLMLNQYDLQSLISLVFCFLEVPTTLNLSLKEFSKDLNGMISLKNKKESVVNETFHTQELIWFSRLEFQVSEILPNAEKFPNFCSKLVEDLNQKDLVYRLMKMNSNLWDSLHKHLPIIFFEVIDESFHDNFSQLYTSNCSNSLKETLILQFLTNCKFPHQVILEPFLHDFFEIRKMGEMEIKKEFPEIWEAFLQSMNDKIKLISLMKISRNWEWIHDCSTIFFFEIFLEHFVHDFFVWELKRMSDELKCALIGLYLNFNQVHFLLSNDQQSLKRISEYLHSVKRNVPPDYSEKLFKRFESVHADLKVHLFPTNDLNKFE
jgi:hypothetical protein